jgi:shikimate kinase
LAILEKRMHQALDEMPAIVCNRQHIQLNGIQIIGSAMRLAARNKRILTWLNGRCVVFVGMMGSGKSAIGRLVAAELNLPYYDSDREIELAAGMSIPEIFEQFGEDYFRSGEQRVVARLLEEGPAVLSLGGGAYINSATRELISRRAISVWLQADAELLMKRILRRPGSRPLLETADPKKTLAELMAIRQPIYSMADLAVESSTMSKKRTCSTVIAAVYERLHAEAMHMGEMENK